jgi:Transposase DDE domain
MDLTELFCKIDDFYQDFLATFSSTFLPTRSKSLPKYCRLAPSEVMTIIIYFHQSSYRTFKDYYTKYVCQYLTEHFPNLVSYNRMVELMPNVLTACWAGDPPSSLYYLNSCQGKSTGISFADSTAIPVCHPKRIKRNKVFKDTAKLSKSSMGWYYGFKLHLIINDSGELLSCLITPGNVDDRKHMPSMTEGIYGKIFADKGYISKELFEQLLNGGLQLITPLKSNMKNKLIPIDDKVLLRKRSLIETVNDQLKNISYLVHSRHRSLHNFMLNLITALIAYAHQPKKPSLKLDNSFFEDFFSLVPI